MVTGGEGKYTFSLFHMESVGQAAKNPVSLNGEQRAALVHFARVHSPL